MGLKINLFWNFLIIDFIRMNKHDNAAVMGQVILYKPK